MHCQKKFLIVFTSLIFVLSLAGCQAKSLPQRKGAVWNLVVIGDSSLWGVGEAYAALIEADLGVSVEVDDFAVGSASAGKVRDVLEGGETTSFQYEKLPEAVKEAEVVIMFLNPLDSINPQKPLNFEACFFSDGPPAACELTGMKQWITDLNAIWGEIIRLRDGKATILRATDLYNPLVTPWKEAGIFEACTACWETMSSAARQAAAVYNIPLLSQLDVLNGPNHDEDPREKGYIQDDGEHLTELGVQRIAEALAAMGYEPTDLP
jgi:hypothetical protein